jgi:hypothetical protein
VGGLARAPAGLARIAALTKEGYDQVGLLRPARLDGRVGDLGPLQTGKSDQLLQALRARYRLIEQGEYPGTYEPASVVVFDLRNPLGGVAVGRLRPKAPLPRSKKESSSP